MLLLLRHFEPAFSDRVWPYAVTLLAGAILAPGQRDYEVGLVNKVVPDAKLMGAALEIADQICLNAPIAVRAHKESIMRALEMPQDQTGPMTREIMKQIQDSEDAREGTAAFAEKRAPMWKNR